MVRVSTQHYIFYVSPESLIVSLGCTIVEEQSQKHKLGAGVQIWWSGAQGGPEILRGTHYLKTDCPRGGGGGGHSVLGSDVCGGQYYILG